MASINCRNGEPHKHESVEAVRACYANVSLTATATATLERPTFRSNRYAGPCALCGARVEADSGRILPKDGAQRGYDVLHLSGQCQKRETAPAVVAPATAPARTRDYSAVLGGYYATVNTRGTNDYDFWYVKEGRKPGYRFVKRVIGGQGPIRITGAEALRALEAILSEGVDVCGNRFADEMCRCRDCGLPLTDEDSRAARRGPVCRNK